MCFVLVVFVVAELPVESGAPEYRTCHDVRAISQKQFSFAPAPPSGEPTIEPSILIR